MTRGRHAGISILASSQVYKGLSSAMRKNFACWALGRLPAVDWRAFEDEHAGVYVSREQLRALARRCFICFFTFFSAAFSAACLIRSCSASCAALTCMRCVPVQLCSYVAV